MYPPRKRLQYTQMDLIAALKAIKDTGMSLRKAGTMFSVPFSTLHFHIRRNREAGGEGHETRNPLAQQVQADVVSELERFPQTIVQNSDKESSKT